MFSKKVLTHELIFFFYEGRRYKHSREKLLLSEDNNFDAFLYVIFVPTCHRAPEVASSDRQGESCDPWQPPAPSEGHTCLMMTPTIQGEFHIFHTNIKEHRHRNFIIEFVL